MNIKFPGWPNLINALQKTGMRQVAIEAKTGISQSFLSNLKSGRREEMEFKRGMRLFALYAERVFGLKLGLVANVAPRKKARLRKR